MDPSTHLVLDVGPNLLQVLLALPIIIAAFSAAYVSIQNGKKIDTANSHLARNLSAASDAKAATALLAEHPTVNSGPEK